MKSLIYLIIFSSIALNFTPMNAQTATKGGLEFLTELDLLERSDENWSFYVDEENMTYFIDFEKIDFNLSDIVIKNHEGETIFKDDVMDLPYDTIYEVDFEPYGTGSYRIELHSFTGIIRKDVEIK